MGKMRTLVGVVICALLLAGCSQPLSTSETCLEIKAIAAIIPDVMPEDPAEMSAIQDKILEQLTKLSDRSSETFKDGLKALVRVVEANTKDQEPTAEDSDAAEVLWTQYESVCLNKE